jgi:polymorphic toxin system nucleotidyltransferase-like protein
MIIVRTQADHLVRTPPGGVLLYRGPSTRWTVGWSGIHGLAVWLGATIADVAAPSDESPLEALRHLAAGQPALRLLLLFGSRARADATSRSDWDFGYLADADFDATGFLSSIVETVETDRVDLVDLTRAGGQLRFRAARDGRVLFAADQVVYPRFWLDAVSFWCEAASVLRVGYEDVLASLR